MTNFDVFLSYDVADSTLARNVKRRLEAHGLSVYASAPLTRRDTAAESGIRRALAESRAFVALMSPKTSHSPWILFESGAAWQQHMPIYVLQKGVRAGEMSGFFQKHARVLALQRLNTLAGALTPTRVAV